MSTYFQGSDTVSQKYKCRFSPIIQSIPKEIKERCVRSVIMQAYLNDEHRTRLREEIRNTTRTYTMTQKIGTGCARIAEKEVLISQKDYESLLKEALYSLVKVRTFLTWNGIDFDLNTYYGHLHGYVQIEIEFDSYEKSCEFVSPQWFGKNVTDDDAHSNYSLAKYGIPE